jgi:hypothetical protein
MRQQRTQRLPVAARATTIRAPTALPASGYALIVDGHAKREFKTQDFCYPSSQRLEGARFPNLQIEVYDAEARRTEQIEIELAPA